MSSAFEVRPITPTIGGEVSGIDLSQDLSDKTIADLHAAFLDRQVLFFRDQDITVDQHIAFGRHFGDLHVNLAAPPYKDGDAVYREVIPIYADQDTPRAGGEVWHSDASCDPEPPSASIMMLHELPPSGGDTLFASMYAAYDALSEAMQGFLGALTAVHDGANNYHYHQLSKGKGAGLDGEAFSRNSHPIVRTHPETDRKSLFVNPLFSTRIDGLSDAERDAILGFLFDHLAQPAFQCRFRWTPNAIAMWDNRCTLHHAIWDYYPRLRSGTRVTVQSDRPY